MTPIAAAIALALFELHSPAATAATINVAGACTLSAAIDSANANNSQNGCTAGSGADTLVLAANATLTLNAALPAIASVITIQGNNATVTRNLAAAEFRVFDVLASGNLTLNSTTVSGGRLSASGAEGGGIRSYGVLTLNRSTVTGNYAYGGGGGILAQDGTLTLTRSTVSSNSARNDGGGIDLDGGVTASIVRSIISGNSSQLDAGGISIAGTDSLTLTRSTVSGNTAGSDGGGIYSDGTLVVTDSVVSGNVANDDGGGIYADDGSLNLSRSTLSGNRAGNKGGGLYNNISASASVIVRHSTISENTGEYGGGIYNNGQIPVFNSTVTRNFASGGAVVGGGGIYNDTGRILTLRNSIISGNFAGTTTGEDLHNLGSLVNEGGNVLGDNAQTCESSLINVPFGTGDFRACAGTGSSGATPLANILSTTLADNGGPSRTHALPAGSPAIDRVAAASCAGATDQRGVNRPKDGNASGTAECDAGAVENGQNRINTSITKSSNGPVVVGDTLNFTVSVVNIGPENASDVEIRDTLPPGLEFISATHPHRANATSRWARCCVSWRICRPSRASTCN